jgi:hypothetical protein
MTVVEISADSQIVSFSHVCGASLAVYGSMLDLRLFTLCTHCFLGALAALRKMFFCLVVQNKKAPEGALM